MEKSLGDVDKRGMQAEVGKKPRLVAGKIVTRERVEPEMPEAEHQCPD
jgi:hypothetical protein